MEKLFCSRTDSLVDQSHPETVLWAESSKLISLNISLIDRTGQIEMPYRFECYEAFRMPTDFTGFNLTYEQCGEKRAWEMIDLSRRLNKPIALFYSGGIDSTLMLITFMKILSARELRERIWVCLNLKSVYENSRFYFDHIIKKCTIKSSYLLSSMLDESVIILGGEHNDQLFGSDTVSEIINMYGYDPVVKPYTKEFIIKFFCERKKFPLTPAAAEIWFDVIDYHIRHDAPCELSTVFDFFWWFNFCFKWQSVYFRMLLRVDMSNRSNITKEYIEQYYHHFYSTIDFQKWSMCNPQEKIRDSWKSYKIRAKELIYDFTGDEDYFKHKVKSGSLNDLFRFKTVPDAFTNHYRFINQIDKTEFYNPNNAFIR